MYNFLEKTDNNKFVNILKYLFTPVFYLFELYVYNKYWKKIILPELIENDEIFDFFDRNEFALTNFNSYIIKKNLISEYEKLAGLSKIEAKIEIQNEFAVTISKLISKNCNQNIEDLMSLEVDIDNFLVKLGGEYIREEIFTVKIQFIRYYKLRQLFNILLFWLFFVITLSTTLFFLL